MNAVVQRFGQQEFITEKTEMLHWFNIVLKPVVETSLTHGGVLELYPGAFFSICLRGTRKKGQDENTEFGVCAIHHIVETIMSQMENIWSVRSDGEWRRGGFSGTLWQTTDRDGKYRQGGTVKTLA